MLSALSILFGFLYQLIGIAGIPDNLKTWGEWLKLLRRKGLEGPPSLCQKLVTVIWDSGNTWGTNDLGKSCADIVAWLKSRDIHVTLDDYGTNWVLCDDDSGYFLPKSIALFRGIKPNVPKRIRIEILGQNK